MLLMEENSERGGGLCSPHKVRDGESCLSFFLIVRFLFLSPSFQTLSLVPYFVNILAERSVKDNMTSTIDVEDLLSKLDIVEKISLLAGTDRFPIPSM